MADVTRLVGLVLLMVALSISGARAGDGETEEDLPPDAKVEGGMFLEQDAQIGTTPDGRPIRCIRYYLQVPVHFFHAMFLTIGDEKYPPALHSLNVRGLGGKETGLDFLSPIFYRDEGHDQWDTVYVSPDGHHVWVTTVTNDERSGRGFTRKRQYQWSEWQNGYYLRQESTIDHSERLIEAVKNALRTGDQWEILKALEDLLSHGARDGALFKEIPAELQVPLWHFYRFTVVERTTRDFEGQSTTGLHGINFLMAFLDKAGVRNADAQGIDYSSSLTVSGVREHMQACLAILDKVGTESGPR